MSANAALPEWNAALIHMLTGHFEAGWVGREARWLVPVPGITYPKIVGPKWLGQENIEGKTILIGADEGLGDSIQFARYVPMVAARGARVILVVAKPVCSLLSELPGVSLCLPMSADPLPSFDMHCPMSSLPLAFGTRLDTIPSALSYLPAAPATRLLEWENRLGPRNRLRVGLVWSGNPTHANDHNRSTSLRMLSRILDADVTFLSLQKDPRPDDQAVLRERTDIIDLTADLTDFSETAALVSCLDLVITVDTSVAHLAAALGRPTWILLPYTPDYRWLLNRDDSPWYPTARLFRQTETRDYGEVLDRVRDELRRLIATQQGDPSVAGEDHSVPISGLATTSPDAFCVVGVQHLKARRYLDAQVCCQQALAIDPDHADALHLMGQLTLQAKQYDHAVEWISRAIRQAPKPKYLSSLGTALRHQGRHDDALKTFDKAVQLKPDDAELWQNLGEILFTLNRPADALLSFQHALKLDPHHWRASHNSGLLLHQQGRFEEALAHFDVCDELQPNNVSTLRLRAVALRQLKRFEQSLSVDQHLHALDPRDIETCHNIGAALRVLGRHEEALTWFDKTLVLQPNLIQALNNKASSLAQLHRFGEAFAFYDRIKALGLNNALTNWNLALLHLLTGNFEAGWVGREARWHIPSFAAKYPAFSGPTWLGEQPLDGKTILNGKTILVGADEGLGDAIQFARYLPMLAARGARVILAVQEPVRVLLSAVPGVAQCIPISLTASPPPFDLHCPMSSLPLAFVTRPDTIPGDISYLPRPDQARVAAWEARLGPRDRLRIGVVWGGNPDHLNDRQRSIPLQTFSRFLDADATFISLQKDSRPSDKAVLLERTDIVDLTAHLCDFTETAALVSCLDLVITVDTSVAHLAGALGCPTWILLPHTPDYRWLLDRDDSPWYPTVRLFRQTETRDYGEVLDRVRHELQALIGVSPQRAVTSPGEAQAASPDALHATGLQHMRAEHYDRAIECFARAIRHDAKPEYLSSLGNALQRQGRLDEALKTFDKALQLAPDDAKLWTSLGDILVELNRSDEALLSLQHALGLDPRHWDAAHRSGFLLHQLGRPKEALSYLDLCDELQPDHAPTLQMRAICLCELRRFEEGLVDIQRAQSLDPANAGLSNNVGLVLKSLGRDEEALAYFDRALAGQPSHVAAFINKASSLHRLRRFDEAVAIYAHVKTIDPANAEADLGLAFLNLLTGDFEAGWSLREARWKSEARRAASPKLPQPMWLGKEPVEGKTILVHLDEGLGDTIQFARYVPMLAARGARVILVVEDTLHRLLSRLPGVAQCLPVSATGTLPDFDLHCSIMSLPLAFGTRLDSIPSQTPYLPAPAASDVRAWEERLGPRTGPRIGIVWSGNPAHDNDRNRSIPLQAFARLLDLDATFVSLQKDPRADDQAFLFGRNDIIDLTAHLADFADTAALISSLDLVISVDTSVAHLAGALGRPTWILLPYVPDWRWLLDRDDSPWYPTTRLFRQAATRDYGEVMDQVRSALVTLIATGDARHIRQPTPTVEADAETLHASGLLFLGAKQYDLALEVIARAIRQDPRPHYLLSLATTLQYLGRSADALHAVDKAVQLQPDDAELWKRLGCMLFEQDRANDALLAFQHTLTLNPNHWEAAEASGFILCQAGRFEEALVQFDLCNTLRPNHAPILAARAVTLRGLNRNEEALADNRRAHALAPNDAEICNNLGDVLTQFPGRFEEALQWLDRALQIRPDWAVALRNKGFVLTQLHRVEQAIATYRQMIALDPTDFNAEWNLSIAYMLTGDFEAGWPAREARWKMPPLTYPKLAQPLWLGAEPITGKTILIYADEGMGDSIQFARYVPMVAALGARVILVVQEPTRTLLSGVSGVSECLAKSVAALPAFDLHCPICSLPLAFGTRLDSIPSGTSYLPRPPASRVLAWEGRLDSLVGPRKKLRVGLVWSGNPVHKNDHNRSSSLPAFLKLLDCDATFVSLQKDPRADDVAVLQERRDIIDVTADLTDFAETAALVSCLDLVITVDTSVAHLAAALGIPTWVLLPYVPDWRWMLDRDDTPWYPTMRLFRQSAARDYGEVLDRVHGALRERIEAGAAPPDAWFEAGRGAVEAGRFEEACEAFKKALPLQPDNAALWKNLGDALIELQKPDAALVSLRKALQLNPDDADAAYLIALISFRSGKFEEAIAQFDLSRHLQPNHALTLQLRGLSFRGLRRYEEFLADSRAAHALDPGNVETRNNIGDALQFLGRTEEALQWFDRALELQPNYIAVLINKASSLQQLHRFDEAAAIYRHIKTFDPDNADADWNLSLLHLLTGNFEAGWARREARWNKTQPLPYPTIAQPIWLGAEPVAGKTVLVVSDEGLGDAIQFARYLPMLADRGARVVALVQDALHPLLSAMSGVHRCFPGSAGARFAIDMHCPMSSLPLAFATRLDTIPAATSYLPPPPLERMRIWEDRLGPRDRVRVGLVWSGSPTHANDHNRSVPLRQFSRITDAIDATFVSLQKDPRPADRAVLAQTDIIDLTADLTDFAETAALINCLDLVITVDTSVAHLAAALGRPTWILLPYTPDYRWLLDRDDSPWYPTVRLFRQSGTRDYCEVIERVRSELSALVSGWRHVAPNPEDVEALHQRGLSALQARQYDDALMSFQHVLRLDPRHWEAASKCGIVLHKLGRLEEAHACFELCHTLQADHVPTLYMRGRALLDLGRFEEALADHQRAYTLDASRPEICNTAGSILRSLGREEEALPWFDRAIALQPNAVEALNNRAVCLGQLQCFDEALATYARAKALNPENAEIDWNMSHLHMLTGNFEAGWAGREARWTKSDRLPYPAFTQPKWLGRQPVEGKTILIWSDEGLGDSIQFARYIPALADRGARVILFVSDPLVPLLAGLRGVSQSFPLSARALPAFDMHCPMGSLPLAFGTRLDTIPSAASYLPAPAEARVKAWEDRLHHRLGPRNRLRVGLVWSGNPKHKNDRNRSSSLRAFSRLFDTGADFVSLQKDPRPEDSAALLERTDIIDLTADLTHFAETAALVACLDLVVTVDTSVAHLAAARGRPTWILLPYTPDYRWLLGRSNSPWYPTARLFRQSETRNYDSVLDQVRNELHALVASR